MPFYCDPNSDEYCYNLMGRDGPEPMIRPLWVAGPIWSCDKNNYS